MGQCYITRKGSSKQFGIYPLGTDGRPIGDVIVPEGITNLYKYIFYYNDTVMAVKLPNTLTTIEDESFRSCKNLQNVTIFDNVTYIGKYAFAYCSKLASVNIPTSVKKIEEYAFAYSPLTTFDIAPREDNNLMAIKSSAFSGSMISNAQAQYFIDHSDFWSNARYQFYNCSNITDIIISNYAPGYGMFYNCINLQSITVTAENYLTKSSLFYNMCGKCTGLLHVSLPTITTANSYLVEASNNPFYECTAITDITLGTGWAVSANFSSSNNLTHDSILAMFNALADLTELPTQTLTIGTTNLEKMTTDEILIATNKNWTLA